jgi:hypothetical protein
LEKVLYYDHYTRRDMALRAARDYAKKYDYEEVKELMAIIGVWYESK